MLLEQAVLVQLDNAIKYNRRGGHVTVRTAVQDGQALMEIRDTSRRSLLKQPLTACVVALQSQNCGKTNPLHWMSGHNDRENLLSWLPLHPPGELSKPR
jgi:hypothetical protein